MTTQLANRLNDLINAKVSRGTPEMHHPVTRESTIELMAEAGGIQPGTVKQILAGSIKKPPPSRLMGFAAVLDVDMHELAKLAGYTHMRGVDL